MYMNKPIQSYNDLLEEKVHLQSLLKVQKEAVLLDIHDISKELEPASSFISFASKLVTRDRSNPLLNAGADTIINLVVKKIFLSRVGWLTRLAVPFLLKNFSSNIISESKDAIMKKLFSWIGKNKMNGHEKVYND
jgi:hypothetical protein